MRKGKLRLSQQLGTHLARGAAFATLATVHVSPDATMADRDGHAIGAKQAPENLSAND